MIKTNSELRKSAMAALSGRWTGVVLTFAVYMIITSMASVLPALGMLSILITLPLFYGVSILFLKFYRFRDYELQLVEIFDGFKDYQRIFLTMLLSSVYTFLWSLVFVVPGIIKSLSYSMTPYILAEEPQLKNDEAIERSMAMMQGHKMQLFLMCLNFAMWVLLSFLTVGILLLWVSPYISTTMAAFYEEVKCDYASKGVIVVD